MPFAPLGIFLVANLPTFIVALCVLLLFACLFTFVGGLGGASRQSTSRTSLLFPCYTSCRTSRIFSRCTCQSRHFFSLNHGHECRHVLNYLSDCVLKEKKITQSFLVKFSREFGWLFCLCPTNPSRKGNKWSEVKINWSTVAMEAQNRVLAGRVSADLT